MSIAEIERFAADLKSNEALRDEAGKAKAETSMVAFAATKGYAFTADEVKEYANAKELTDAELDGVAGGGSQEDLQRAIEANQNLSESASYEKANMLAEQQMSDILTSINKALNATIISTPRSIK